jgi:hypothetical protein
MAAPDAKVEVFDPHETWLEGERWGVYIKVTNTSDEAFPLLFHPDSNSEYLQLFVTAEFGNPSSPEVPRDLLAKPLPQGERSNWGAIASAGEGHSVLVRPGESFVYGPEAVLETEGLYALSSRRMATYQVHLLIGDGHWVSSELEKRKFIIDNEAWENEIVGEVEGASANVKLPFRKISIDGLTWLFEGRQRLCIVPDGATPRISTFDNREFVRIEFEGSEEEPVVTSNRHGHPLSGSVRTVPHLYLWKSLTSRPMGAATPDTRTDKAEAVPGEGESSGTAPQPNASAPPEGGHATGSPALWITLGVGAVLLAGAAWLRRHRAG